MTNVNLSRRVAKLMAKEPIVSLPYEERFKFVREVDNAPFFEELSDSAKAIIKQAEMQEK